MRAIAGVALFCSLASTTARAQPLSSATITLTTPASATSFVLARSGKVGAAVCGDALLVWSLPDGRVLRTIALGQRSLDVVVMSADGGAIAAGDHAGKYSVWDTSTGAEQLQLTMPYYPAAMAFSPDGKRLAIAPVGEPVQIYALASGVRLMELQRPTGGSAALAFSRDGSRIAAADADTVVRIYDAGSGHLLSSNADFVMEPLAATFNADGTQVLAGGGDKVVGVFDAAKGTMTRKSSRFDDPVSLLDVSPDGTLVAAVLMHADNMLKPGAVFVSELASGKRVAQWMPSTLAIGGGWTDDGHLLIATAAGTALSIWRMR